jgi:hypothetical protein
MIIKSQDSDTLFPLTDKGFGTIYLEDVYVNGRFYGSNIYGRRFFKSYLLGTYEENEAEMVIDEIFTMLKMGAEHYVMPQPTLELDQMGVEL